jgi:phytanoyl-CoA hydroxylase
MTSERPLTEFELKGLRLEAKGKLTQLSRELSETRVTDFHLSWLNGQVPNQECTDKCRYFDRYGFLHIPQFASTEEIRAMKHQMASLIQDWDPAEKTLAFSTEIIEGNQQVQGSDDYFLESASRVHFFAETNALQENGSLKQEYVMKKLNALNKSGHAMHIIEGAFRDYTLSDKVKSLVAELGWKDPIVPQSMYICKNPKIGGTVHSHQDSTFLFTEPRQSCLGLWLALDDATLMNGCLWVRPTSHKEPLRRQYKRNELHFTGRVIEERSNVAKGDLSQPKMIFEVLDPNGVDWEGGLPKDLLETGFIPIECKAGDLLAFCGTLDHLSLPNHSDEQRHTFQLHLVEGPYAGVSWSTSNWLQYPKAKKFLSIKK